MFGREESRPQPVIPRPPPCVRPEAPISRSAFGHMATLPGSGGKEAGAGVTSRVTRTAPKGRPGAEGR